MNPKKLPELKLPELKYEEDLRGTVINKNDWEDFVLNNEEKLTDIKDNDLRRHYYEHLGLAHRSLNQLDQGEHYLQMALSLSYEDGKPYKVGQNLIRLAHVYQWKKQFFKAKALFDQVKSLLNELEISDVLRAAYHQHFGKFYFDQQYYGLAVTEFALALKIRKEINSPDDQLKSSEFALQIASQKWEIKLSQDIVVRRAQVSDAKAIHDAHMLSINEICSKNHTVDEIRVWGGRTFEQVNRLPAIKDDFYLVIEFEGKIEGFCQLKAVLENCTKREPPSCKSGIHPFS